MITATSQLDEYPENRISGSTSQQPQIQRLCSRAFSCISNLVKKCLYLTRSQATPSSINCNAAIDKCSQVKEKIESLEPGTTKLFLEKKLQDETGGEKTQTPNYKLECLESWVDYAKRTQEQLNDLKPSLNEISLPCEKVLLLPAISHPEFKAMDDQLKEYIEGELNESPEIYVEPSHDPIQAKQAYKRKCTERDEFNEKIKGLTKEINGMISDSDLLVPKSVIDTLFNNLDSLNLKENGSPSPLQTTGVAPTQLEVELEGKLKVLRRINGALLAHKSNFLKQLPPLLSKEKKQSYLDQLYATNKVNEGLIELFLGEEPLTEDTSDLKKVKGLFNNEMKIIQEAHNRACVTGTIKNKNWQEDIEIWERLLNHHSSQITPEGDSLRHKDPIKKAFESALTALKEGKENTYLAKFYPGPKIFHAREDLQRFLDLCYTQYLNNKNLKTHWSGYTEFEQEHEAQRYTAYLLKAISKTQRNIDKGGNGVNTLPDFIFEITYFLYRADNFDKDDDFTGFEIPNFMTVAQRWYNATHIR